MQKDNNFFVNVPAIIMPDWPVPAHVKALTTTRKGGVSQGAFDANNFALHVEDNASDVAKNRALLRKTAKLPTEPFWLKQTHSTMVVEARGANDLSEPVNADASFSKNPNEVCVVMTADCLPILLCDKKGKQVAAIHAGWRGLLNGIIENTLSVFSAAGHDIGHDRGHEIVAWLGPAIGPMAFEVGTEVKDLFVAHDLDAQQAFRQCTEDKWLADLYQLARIRLKNAGVASVYGGKYCTFRDESAFYSYRRDKICGRMATLIWLSK